MTVDDKLKLLEEKLGQLMTLVERLKKENTLLRNDNGHCKNELAKVQQELTRLKLEQNDQTEAVRTRLQVLLTHVEELESSQS